MSEARANGFAGQRARHVDGEARGGTDARAIVVDAGDVDGQFVARGHRAGGPAPSAAAIMGSETS